MNKAPDLIGKRFGKLVVQDRTDSYIGKTYTQSQWKCICDCGNYVVVRGVQLTGCRTKSCGCLRVEVPKAVNRRHGHAPRGIQGKTYTIWCSMKLRCTNKNEQNFKYYGGRGISFDSKWNEYLGFLDDMGECPSGYTLERIDVNGNYNKENCKWIPKAQQAWNTRNTKMVILNGETKPFPVWINELGLNYAKIYRRLNLGWTPENAFLKP